jgi:hypothetical protein
VTKPLYEFYITFVFKPYALSNLRFEYLIFTANTSRVILRTDGASYKGDYINASFVDVSIWEVLKEILASIYINCKHEILKRSVQNLRSVEFDRGHGATGTSP